MIFLPLVSCLEPWSSVKGNLVTKLISSLESFRVFRISLANSGKPGKMDVIEVEPHVF